MMTTLETVGAYRLDPMATMSLPSSSDAVPTATARCIAAERMSCPTITASVPVHELATPAPTTTLFDSVELAAADAPTTTVS